MERKQLTASLHTYEGSGLYDITNRHIDELDEETKSQFLAMPEYWLHIPCGILFEDPGVGLIKDLERQFNITMVPIDSGLRIYAYVNSQDSKGEMPGYEDRSGYSDRITSRDVDYDTNLIKMGADIQSAIQCVMESVLERVVKQINTDPWSKYHCVIDWETTVCHFYTMMRYHTRRIGEFLERERQQEQE